MYTIMFIRNERQWTCNCFIGQELPFIRINSQMKIWRINLMHAQDYNIKEKIDYQNTPAQTCLWLSIRRLSSVKIMHVLFMLHVELAFAMWIRTLFDRSVFWTLFNRSVFFSQQRHITLMINHSLFLFFFFFYFHFIHFSTLINYFHK